MSLRIKCLKWMFFAVCLAEVAPLLFVLLFPEQGRQGFNLAAFTRYAGHSALLIIGGGIYLSVIGDCWADGVPPSMGWLLAWLSLPPLFGMVGRALYLDFISQETVDGATIIIRAAAAIFIIGAATRLKHDFWVEMASRIGN